MLFLQYFYTLCTVQTYLMPSFGGGICNALVPPMWVCVLVLSKCQSISLIVLPCCIQHTLHASVCFVPERSCWTVPHCYPDRWGRGGRCQDRRVRAELLTPDGLLQRREPESVMTTAQETDTPSHSTISRDSKEVKIHLPLSLFFWITQHTLNLILWPLIEVVPPWQVLLGTLIFGSWCR